MQRSDEADNNIPVDIPTPVVIRTVVYTVYSFVL